MTGLVGEKMMYNMKKIKICSLCLMIVLLVAGCKEKISSGKRDHPENTAPLAEELKDTMWSIQRSPESGGRSAVYFLDLYGSEDSECGDYEGEASFTWLYDGDEEYQETYEGWWRLEDVSGQVCLRLDLLCTGGVLFSGDENPKRISDLFPLQWEMWKENLALYKGIQKGTLLPFHREQWEYESLLKTVG